MSIRHTIALAAAAATIASAAGTARATWLSGNVQTWGATPPYFQDVSYPAGRRVDAVVTVSYPVYDPYTVCGQRCEQYSYVATTYTDGAGNYGLDIPDSNWGCYWDSTGGTEIIADSGLMNCYYTAEPGVRVSLTSPGSETVPAHAEWNGWASGFYGLAITNTPHYLSPSGMVWARRVGTGPQGAYLVEGFDGGNITNSRFYYGLFALSAVNGSNLMAQLLPNRTVWLLMYTDGGASIMGHNGVGTDGLAYESMRLVKSIHDTHHAGQPAVVGGYSMGGVVAWTGLQRWCDGRWAGYGLPAGCHEVKLMITADSPLSGAVGVVALQRYAKDNRVAGKVPNRELLLKNVNTWAARELLRIWITDGCSTDCDDFGGCSSHDDKFRWDCWPDNSRRAAFEQFTAGEVRRNDYSLVPAITLSMGQTPYGSPTCNRNPFTGGWAQFIGVDINNARDHHLYPDSAGGAWECAPGSRLNLLENVAGAHGSIEKDGWTSFPLFAWIGNYFKLTVYYHPTYIPAESALLWNRRGIWRAWWANSSNDGHVPAGGLPAAASSFILDGIRRATSGCVWEYGNSCDGGDVDYCYEGTIQCDGSCGDWSGDDYEVCGDWYDNNCDGMIDEYCGGGCIDPYSCNAV